MRPSDAEIETTGTRFRGLGAKELRRRLDSNEIGRAWEQRVAWNVLRDLAADKEARRPTGSENAGRLVVLVVALALALKLLGII